MASYLGRRKFLATLGGAAAWPLAARAQQAPIRPLIGVLSPLLAVLGARNVAAFRSGLRDLGYVEGRNVTLALRYGEGAPERMPLLARELIALNPDVIVAGSQSGALAAHDATRTIPIVANTAEDPVVSGFASSFARPGGNITGTWVTGDHSLVGKRLDFLKLAIPGLARVGAIVNPDDPTDRVEIAHLPVAARALGLALEFIEVRDTGKLDTVAAAVERAGVQGLLVGQGPALLSVRKDVVAMVQRLKLPAVSAFREFAEAGGLISYGPSLPDVYRQSARLVVQILNGAKPADLPFELPSRYDLIVNLKTSKAMGLKLPDAFLLLADEVIE
jgi:putative ABC transport system substrate-binding protein